MKNQKSYVGELGVYSTPDWVLFLDEKYKMNSGGIRSSQNEEINKIQQSIVKTIEYCLFLIFDELKIKFSIENIKRITIQEQNYVGTSKNYYLDYEKENEVFLFSEYWEMPDWSKNYNKVTCNHIIKSNFKSVKSFFEVCNTLEKMNVEFNKPEVKKTLNSLSNKEWRNMTEMFMDECSDVIPNDDGLLKRISK